MRAAQEMLIQLLEEEPFTTDHEFLQSNSCRDSENAKMVIKDSPSQLYICSSKYSQMSSTKYFLLKICKKTMPLTKADKIRVCLHPRKVNVQFYISNHLQKSRLTNIMLYICRLKKDANHLMIKRTTDASLDIVSRCHHYCTLNISYQNWSV